MTVVTICVVANTKMGIKCGNFFYCLIHPNNIGFRKMIGPMKDLRKFMLFLDWSKTTTLRDLSNWSILSTQCQYFLFYNGITISPRLGKTSHFKGSEVPIQD